MKTSLGLYVHIPFCLRKCAYCDFPSYPDQLALRGPYQEALCREITSRGEALGHPAADTLFIGGGTPSLMAPEQMSAILQALQTAFPWAPDMEASCEANPETLTPAFVEALVKGGVNRLSLGAQASQPHLLQVIGRGHSWQQVEEAVRMARAGGIRNLNLDLMLGLPGQTPENVKETLDAALALSPQHLSCYSLILEEDSALHRQVEEGKLRLPDEDSLLQMDQVLARTLQAAGYHQYEVSNFSLQGYACRHNRNCWQYEDYLGFGAAAAGFYQGIRRKNPERVHDYLAGMSPEEQRVSPAESRFEQLMLGLRMTEGLSEKRFEARQGMTLMAAFGEVISRHLKEGLLTWEQGHLRLTPRGQRLMNQVLMDFLP